MSVEHLINAPRWYRTRNGKMALAVVAAAAVFLLVEHWAHALPYLPSLLILACPLLHVFMHGGHGGHAGHGHGGGQGDTDKPNQGA